MCSIGSELQEDDFCSLLCILKELLIDVCEYRKLCLYDDNTCRGPQPNSTGWDLSQDYKMVKMAGVVCWAIPIEISTMGNLKLSTFRQVRMSNSIAHHDCSSLYMFAITKTWWQDGCMCWAPGLAKVVIAMTQLSTSHTSITQVYVCARWRVLKL